MKNKYYLTIQASFQACDKRQPKLKTDYVTDHFRTFHTYKHFLKLHSWIVKSIIVRVTSFIWYCNVLRRRYVPGEAGIRHVLRHLDHVPPECLQTRDRMTTRPCPSYQHALCSNLVGTTSVFHHPPCTALPLSIPYSICVAWLFVCISGPKNRLRRFSSNVVNKLFLNEKLVDGSQT